MTDEVSTRIPTPDEALTLGLVPSQLGLITERATRDAEGWPTELVCLVATADRTVVVYAEGLITPHG